MLFSEVFSSFLFDFCFNRSSLHMLSILVIYFSEIDLNSRGMFSILKTDLKQAYASFKIGDGLLINWNIHIIQSLCLLKSKDDLVLFHNILMHQ